MNFDEKLLEYRQQVEKSMTNLLPSADTRPSILHQAMHYSMQAGGKRLRPTLLLATFDLQASDIDPLPAACAIECIHTYSLIHDDLPCMDNSDLRRGQATCHIQYDEATALLAGDALLTYAFQLLSHHYQEQPQIGLALTRSLSQASGSEKLIGGQMEDLIGEREQYNEDSIHFIHTNKTAALIRSALNMGMILSQNPQQDISDAIGLELGLAFQIVDDILDVTQDTATLGKPQNIDIANDKMTYITLYGLTEAKKLASQHTQKAQKLCQRLNGDSSFLQELISQMEKRIH